MYMNNDCEILNADTLDIVCECEKLDELTKAKLDYALSDLVEMEGYR